MNKRYSGLKNKVTHQLDQTEQALPLAQRFNEAHGKFLEWLDVVEPELRGKETAGLDAEEAVDVSVRNATLFPLLMKYCKDVVLWDAHVNQKQHQGRNF